jgi:hypothetical protein
MPPDERPKRPQLSRTDAIRSWSALFGVGDNAGGKEAQQPGDVIARSVELGYRVVDEYIRQGRKAAERLGGPSLGPAALGGDVTELGARMMRYATEMMGLWMQLADATMGAGAPRSAAPAASPAPASEETPSARPGASDATVGSSPPRAGDGVRVRIEVASLWPTEVWLDLRPEGVHVPVVAHALRAGDPALPRLDDVTFSNGALDEPPLLRVRIPPSQPAGIYNGLLIDSRTSRPVGTVSVRVSREEKRG